MPTLPSHPPSPRAHHRRPPRSLSPRAVRCFLPPPPSSLFVLSAPTRARTASPPFRTVPSASACWGRHTIENWAQPCFVSLVSAVCTAHTRDNEAYKISAQQPHLSPAFATARSSFPQPLVQLAITILEGAHASAADIEQGVHLVCRPPRRPGCGRRQCYRNDGLAVPRS